MNKLVVTFDNIPDGMIEEYWRGAIKAAPDHENVNIKIEPTENIYYNYEEIVKLITPIGTGRMLAAMITPQVIQIHDKNKRK